MGKPAPAGLPQEFGRRSVTGDVSIWLMDGSRIADFHSMGNVWTGWSISGVGDFNGDNRSDTFGQDAAGNVVIWMMDGNNLMAVGG
jgi:hypothetical protein